MSKLLRNGIIASFVVLICAGLFSAGMVVGRYSVIGGTSALTFPGLNGGVFGTAPAGTPTELTATFAPFWEAWNVVHEEYVDQPLDDQALAYGAIRGMLDALDDPHTGYSTPAESAVLFSDMQGQLEGIGAEVAAKGDLVEIVSPMPGSPAEAAGILPGDLIAAIDGKDIAGQDLFTVIDQVRGPAGTKVVLTILRESETAPLEFEITRAKIEIPSVESKELQGNIAYVKINSFGDTTVSELQAQLETLMAGNPAGLVLDLRGNPGGSRDAAVEVASQFIGDGLIMVQRYGDGREVKFDAQPGGLATNVPMVVLVNAGSASASEIVAGAIQDHARGQIVGEQSYGKGTVQDWRRLTGDNGTVRITIARWLTPNGTSVTGVGITPDVPVERTPDDLAARLDPQLDAALQLLTGQPVPETGA